MMHSIDVHSFQNPLDPFAGHLGNGEMETVLSLQTFTSPEGPGMLQALTTGCHTGTCTADTSGCITDACG